MTESGQADPVYVYAVLGGDSPDSLLADSLLAGGSLLDSLAQAGVDPERPVTLLRAGSIVAVVSHVRYELFNEQVVRQGLEDNHWLANNVLAHQRVLDALVRAGLPLIPMRFCTLYMDAGALVASLERHSQPFADELQRIRGKQEWGLKMAVDSQVLQAAVAAGHPTLAGAAVDADIERLRKQIAGMSAGAAFLLKKKLSNLIAERAQSIAFNIADVTYQSLCEVALEATTIDLPKDRPDICLNAVFWLETDCYPIFVARLEALAQSFAGVGAGYELSGPWPTHHFLRMALDVEVAS